MNAMKAWFQKEINRIKNIQDGSDLYVVFFRVTQLLTVIGGVHLMLALIPAYMSIPAIPAEILGQPEMQSVWRTMYSTIAYSLFMLVAWIVIAEIALRMMDKGNSTGLYIGLTLSLLSLPSLYFLVGLFGMYALLNKSAQQKFLSEAPVWFKDLLKAMSIDYTRPNNAQ